MGKIKRFGKPLKCDKQYKRESKELSALFPPRLGKYEFGGFELIYCHDNDAICGFLGREEECPKYKIRLP